MALSRRLLAVAHGGGSSFTPPLNPPPPDQARGLPGTFTKYASNPVLAPGDPGDWD